MIKGLALDIDETLSFTIEFWVDRLQEKFGNPENLTPREVIQKYKFAQNAPYWQTKEALAWMEEARISNEIQEILPVIENSQKTVEKIHKIIPITAYITIRSEIVVPGTVKWLEKHGFPKAPVIAKPNNMPLDVASKWKAKTLKDLYPNILGIIDDNPSIIEHLDDEYKGFVFLYDNLDHPKKSKNIIPCKSWDDVLLEVRNVSESLSSLY